MITVMMGKQNRQQHWTYTQHTVIDQHLKEL